MENSATLLPAFRTFFVMLMDGRGKIGLIFLFSAPTTVYRAQWFQIHGLHSFLTLVRTLVRIFDDFSLHFPMLCRTFCSVFLIFSAHLCAVL